MSGDDIAYLIYLAILLAFVGGGILYRRRESLNQTMQQMLIWVLIFLGAVLLFSFKDTLSQQLFPYQGSGDTYTLQRQPDGHFYTTLEVNGKPVNFIVDTGASQIVLTQQDAKRVGLDPAGLAYFGRANTANGTVKTALVVLNRVTFGDVTDTRVRATVNGGQMSESLLGMSYLSRFQEMNMRGNTLTLTR